MYLLLSLLLLSALAPPPAYSDYDSFNLKHIHNEDRPLDCRRSMANLPTPSNLRCKPRNDFIITSVSTPASTVHTVCTNTGGTFKGKTQYGTFLYESINTFNVVSCRWDQTKTQECAYIQSQPQAVKICLACDRNREPVHVAPLQSCQNPPRKSN